ncbi:MAG: D-serine ammonia-lyase [Clostridia bacterium]|nr:D-serine ammonia-lyase [Clostridia bacterium]
MMDISRLEQDVPIVKQIKNGEEVFWLNDSKKPFAEAIADSPLTMEDVLDAAARLDRFASYFKTAFPETMKTDGIIESPLMEIARMKEYLQQAYTCEIGGKLYAKLDSHLAISGSIKARGGFYEVLSTAEKIALDHGILKEDDDYAIFASEAFRQLFSKYSIAVGSTGNLGLSIGILSAKLGFRASVHMSADARQWKKDMLRANGVEVVEYESDYSIAVANGRALAASDPYCHFVDDENSKTLFLGYAVAALRLKKQFEAQKITVDADHPLFVYLPCGVGGGPGGVAFGLKLVFGDNVHCFFAEPTDSACMLLGMATGLHNKISVQDIGLSNRTVADGLAVGRASGFVGRVMMPHISGCFSLTDQRMFKLLAALADTQSIYLEPSALAGMYGPVLLAQHADSFTIQNATHLVWATGGSMVPEAEMQKYYQTGKSLL